MCHFLLVINCNQGHILYRLRYSLRQVHHCSNLLPLVFNDPDGGVCSPGTISTKFCTEVKGWLLEYKMAKTIAKNFNPLSRAHKHYRKTDERRICDSKYPECKVGMFG